MALVATAAVRIIGGRCGGGGVGGRGGIFGGAVRTPRPHLFLGGWKVPRFLVECGGGGSAAVAGAGGFDDFPDFGAELVGFEGFLEEAVEAVGTEAGGDFLFVEAAHEEDAGGGFAAADFAEGFGTVHLGHGEVEEDEGDLVGGAGEDLDGFAAIGRFEGLEAERFDECGADGADAGFVVNDEDGAGAPPFTG